MTGEIEVGRLKSELLGLFQYIQRMRSEIAAIDRPAEEDFQFENMADQLDAIVKATDQATHTIMAAMEKNEEIVAELKEAVSEPRLAALLDKISENGNAVFEACSFQDITGQRVSKVLKSVTYVEERVNSLIEIWGREELNKVEVAPASEKSEDEKLLHGPALEKEQSLAQAEIDALFD